MISKVFHILSRFAAKLSSYGVFTFAGYEIGQKLIGDNHDKTTIEIKTNNSEPQESSILLPMCFVFCFIIILIITCACTKELYVILKKEKKTKDNDIEFQERRIASRSE